MWRTWFGVPLARHRAIACVDKFGERPVFVRGVEARTDIDGLVAESPQELGASQRSSGAPLVLSARPDATRLAQRVSRLRCWPCAHRSQASAVERRGVAVRPGHLTRGRRREGGR